MFRSAPTTPTPRRMALAVLAQGGGADFDGYLQIARIAERGKFDTLLLPGYEAPDVDAPSRTDGETVFDPVMLMAALSAVTDHIGLIAAADPSFDQPYNIARRIVSADHLSEGRAGWTLAIGETRNQSLNYGLADPPPRPQRYDRAREFAQVVLGLWDSWDDDAFLLDRAGGRFFEPAKMHFLSHKGEHFMVRGPLNVARSLQGRPVVAHGGVGEAARDLAAEFAEIVYVAPADLARAQAFYADLKSRMAEFGRDPAALKVLPEIRPVVGRTAQQAEDRMANLAERGADSSDTVLTVCGTAEHIADRLQQRFEANAADGFTLTPSPALSGLADFVDLVVPELQRRGLFRTEYDGRFLREHLGLPIPPASRGGERACAAGA